MQIFSIVLILSAGLIAQSAWADHHHDDGHRQQQDNRRFEQPRFEQRQDPRNFQRDDRRAPQQFQRDPRGYPQQQPFQRAPQANFAPRNEPQFARPGNDFSAGDAARRAQQMNGGGRILAVDPNGPGYRVKVLKEGEVRVIAVPGG